MKRFSIVIPAHNGERYLGRTIASALAQTRPADEILIVDDASTDRTAEIAQQAEFQPRIGYRYNAHATGFVDAWNRAVEYAAGEYVTILHQDDLLYPGYLDSIERALDRFPSAQHLYAACNYIDEFDKVTRQPPAPHALQPTLYQGREYAHNYLSGILTNHHIHRCPGVTTKRSLLLNICSYRKEAGHIADDDLFLRVGAFTDVVGISQPLASFREHSSSATGKLPLLSLRLAQDYLFQSRYYLENMTILEQDDIAAIQGQTVRFINLLLFQALTSNNRDRVGTALALRAEFEALLPGHMDEALPRWGRPMWRLSESAGTALRPAMLYAHAIAAAIWLRDRARNQRVST